MLTREMFKRQWPKADVAMLDGILQTQGEVLQRFDITTKLRLAHFMGQISVECTNGTRFVENLTYTTAARLKAVYPRFFPTIQSATPYLRKPEMLANLVYGGRYGNRPGTGDGWAFRGRGLIQLTFRGNYETIGAIAGVDLVTNPEMVNSRTYALQVAGAFWKNAKCNAVADVDVVPAVTKRINGGQNGLHERIEATTSWKGELGV